MPPPVRDNTLDSGVRANKTRRDTAHYGTHSSIVPSLPLAKANVNGGSLFVVDNDLYLGTGTRATKIASASPTGIIRFEDSDGDTYVQVDNGSDNDKIVLTAIAAAVDAVQVNALTTGGGIDINGGTGGITVDSAGSLSLDSTAASNLTVTGAALDLTLSSVGGSVVVTATEGAVDAVQVNALTAGGGIDINAGTGGITIDATGASNFTVTGAANLTASSTLGSVILTSNKAAVDAVQVNALPGGAGGIDINAGTGGITVDATGTSNFTVTGAANLTASSTLGSVILTSGKAAVDSVKIDGLSLSAGGGVTIQSGTGNTTLTSTGNIALTPTLQTNIQGATFKAGAISVGVTLGVSDSGSLFEITAGAGYTITLPAPTAGLWFRFILITPGAGDVIISSSGANIYGTTEIANVTTNQSALTTIRFKAAATAGSHMEFFGASTTKYMLRAITATAAGFTVT